jgi:hypothetical protein
MLGPVSMVQWLLILSVLRWAESICNKGDFDAAIGVFEGKVSFA